MIRITHITIHITIQIHTHTHTHLRLDVILGAQGARGVDDLLHHLHALLGLFVVPPSHLCVCVCVYVCVYVCVCVCVCVRLGKLLKKANDWKGRTHLHV